VASFKDFREKIDKGFDPWCFEVYPEMSTAYAEAVKIIEDNPVLIETQLEILSTHLPRIKDICAVADCFLDVEAYRKYTSEGENALHRKLRNDYEVAEIRAIRDKVVGLVKSIEVRIMVLQSRLKSANQEKNQGYQK